jgi:hypothetical protein
MEKLDVFRQRPQFVGAPSLLKIIHFKHVVPKLDIHTTLSRESLRSSAWARSRPSSSAYWALIPKM